MTITDTQLQALRVLAGAPGDGICIRRATSDALVREGLAQRTGTRLEITAAGRELVQHFGARLHGRVQIHFPTYARFGYVTEDSGGPKVKVRWRTQKRYVGGPHGPRRVLLAYPRSHEQWFPRERLEQA